MNKGQEYVQSKVAKCAIDSQCANQEPLFTRQDLLEAYEAGYNEGKQSDINLRKLEEENWVLRHQLECL